MLVQQSRSHFGVSHIFDQIVFQRHHTFDHRVRSVATRRWGNSKVLCGITGRRMVARRWTGIRQETGVSKRPERVGQSRHALRRKSDKKDVKKAAHSPPAGWVRASWRLALSAPTARLLETGKKRIGDPEHVGRVTRRELTRFLSHSRPFS